MVFVWSYAVDYRTTVTTFGFLFGLLVSADAAPALELKCEAIAASAVVLRWSKPETGITGYLLERRTPRDKSWRPLAELSADAASFESVGVLGGERCEHRIRVKTADGNGDWLEFDPVVTPKAGDPDYGVALTSPSPGYQRTSEGSMILAKDGTLLFIFGQWPSVSDDAIGVRLAAMRSTDRGATWTEPVVCLSNPQYDLYHPSISRMANGEIGLTYTKRKPNKPRQQTSEKVFRYSSDEGATWSDEIMISDGDWQFYQTSAFDRLRVLKNGRLVHPVSRRPIPGNEAIVTLVYTSDDYGRTWQRRTAEPIAEDSKGMFHEADIQEYAPGKLLMLGRTLTGWFYESRSDDGGDTWSAAAITNIPSAVAPPKLITDPAEKSLLLIWNPYVGSVNPRALGPRLILASWRSTDGGKTWSGYREIVHDSKLAKKFRDGYSGFSYASGIWLNRQLHLTYTDYFGTDRNTIRVRYLQPQW